MTLRASLLSQAMVNQLPLAWSQVKGTTYPGGDTEDAEVMFRAVALGLISFLQTAEGQGALNTITTTGGPGPSFNISTVVWRTDLT